jgi:16S rRNA (adenine1518-N6/adenine1519-N6)-dimethyltransferase
VTSPESGGAPPSGRFPPVRKSLGQHFLTDRRILARIADAAELAPSDVVIEIGPGRGSLTDILAERAGRVIAVEYDRALAAALRDRYATQPGVTVVEANVLETDLAALAAERGGTEYKVIGNVPYYITTPILFHALRRPRPTIAVYLVQREVGERVVAPPGSKQYGALSVNVQAVAVAEMVFRIPPGAFQPPPKVESAVIRIRPRAIPAVAPSDEAEFRSFVQAAFGMRRKQVQKTLREILGLGAGEVSQRLAAAGIDPAARVETLSPEQIAMLAPLTTGQPRPSPTDRRSRT